MKYKYSLVLYSILLEKMRSSELGMRHSSRVIRKWMPGGAIISHVSLSISSFCNLVLKGGGQFPPPLSQCWKGDNPAGFYSIWKTILPLDWQHWRSLSVLTWWREKKHSCPAMMITLICRIRTRTRDLYTSLFYETVSAPSKSCACLCF